MLREFREGREAEVEEPEGVAVFEATLEIQPGGDAVMGSNAGGAKTGLRGRRSTVRFLCSKVTVLALQSMTAPVL